MAAAIALSAGAAQASNLLTNGSFELFTNAGSPGETVLFPGATNLDGWTVIGADNTHNLLLCGPGGCGASASDGSHFLDLTGITNAAPFTGVSQTVNTIAGDNYVLSFDEGGRGDSTDGTILARAGAVSGSFSFTAPAYVTHTLSFVGTGSPTQISLLGTAASGIDLSLDNVILTDVSGSAVPEPASWALMILGFGGLGASLRRRSRVRTA